MLMRSMEKARRRRLAGEGGFTLVELIVVIAILGILAAIVVFAVGGITNKGQTEANKTTCSVLQTAEEAYFAKTGSYVTEETFAAPATSAQDALDAGDARGLTPRLIELLGRRGVTTPDDIARFLGEPRAGLNDPGLLPDATLPEKAKAYGVHCKGESKKHVKGVKGTPFSQCVVAMAKLQKQQEG